MDLHLDKIEKKTNHNVHHDCMHGHHHHLWYDGGKIHGQDRYNTLDHYHPLCNLENGGHTMDHHLDKLEKTDHNVSHHVAKYERSDDGMRGNHHHLSNGGAKILGQDRCNTLDHYHPLYNLGYWGHTKDHHLDKLGKKTDHSVRRHVAKYEGSDDGMHGHHHHLDKGDTKILGQDRCNTLDHYHPLYNLGYWGHTKDHHLDKLEKKTDHNVRHHVAKYEGSDDGMHGHHHHLGNGGAKIHGRDIYNTLDHYHPLYNLGYWGHI